MLVERDDYRQGIEKEETSESLNVDLLEKTLDSLLPPANKYYFEVYSDLLEELNALGVMTRKDLEKLVRTHLKNALAEDKQKAARRLEKGTDPEGRFAIGVFWGHSGLVRAMMRAKFGKAYDNYLKEKKRRRAAEAE